MLKGADIPVDYFIKGYPFLSDAQYEDVVPTSIHEVGNIRVIPLIKPIVMDQVYF